MTDRLTTNEKVERAAFTLMLGTLFSLVLAAVSAVIWVLAQ